MTKKDYEAIASSIAFTVHIGENLTTENESENYIEGFEAGTRFAANEIAISLQDDNPRFNRDMFLRACGL